MANKRQRKKAAKMAAVYEGRQYQGGRVEGRKNLTRLPNGNIINQEGVMFTEEEKKKMEQLVNSVNRKRVRMQKVSDQLPRKNAGKDTGDKLGQLRLMGKEDEFILSRRSKSLQRFTSREQFDNYVKSLERALDPNYITERIRDYKRNYLKGFQETFGDAGKDVYMKIRMMKPDEYMKLVQSDEKLEINFYYTSTEKDAKLNVIRAALGMKQKDEDFYDGDEYE